MNCGAARCDYPLHLGVTEAGSERMGVIKNAIGIGSPLAARHRRHDPRLFDGPTPCARSWRGRDILRALNLGKPGPQIISCPTCGRTRIDLLRIEKEVEERLRGCKKPITVAVMGLRGQRPRRGPRGGRRHRRRRRRRPRLPERRDRPQGPGRGARRRAACADRAALRAPFRDLPRPLSAPNSKFPKTGSTAAPAPCGGGRLL